MTDSTNSAEHDEAAVSAVQRGNPERYRELVERHERRVYAVAWSRLGDAALAEEVTQEAFIRAYQKLWLLGDGAKFSGWVNTIARRLAINFGLRHRRELDKRQRWALENPEISTADISTVEADPLHTPETLRQTLAELPAAHRECLVLFYLEGKSGADAAAALGISETALRVRLHRARAALRDRLEQSIEGSLSKLTPPKTQVPVIMAAVLASSSAKAATAGGVGAAMAVTLAKFTPVKWLFTVLAFVPLVLPTIMFLPALLFHRIRVRDEQRNYRDPKGFRAILYRKFNPGFGVVLLFIIGMVLFFYTSAARIFEPKQVFFIIGLFSLVIAGFATRQLFINCSRHQIGLVVNSLVMGAACWSISLGLLPISAVLLACLLSTTLTIFSNQTRPLRMDYNLFLRATQGVFLLTNENGQKKTSGLDRPALRAFARFLGERRLVNNYQWDSSGLTLYLTTFQSVWILWHQVFPSVKNNSFITLGWDGSVLAHCGENDAASLENLRCHSTSNLPRLEQDVADAVSRTWMCFREGKIGLAEQAIGQIPESDIFITPPTRTRATIWTRIIVGSMVAVSLLLICSSWIFSEWLSGLKPVSFTEAQVRAFINDTTPNPDPNKFRFNSADTALSECIILPPTNLFTFEGLKAIHEDIFKCSGFNPRGDEDQRLMPFQHYWMMHKSMEGGWVNWDDVNLKPQDATKYFHRLGTNGWQFMLSHERAWSWVKNTGWDVERINDFALNQLRWMHDVNCLDMIDREKLIQQIASVQVLSGTPPGQPPIHDWKDVRGLFFTPCWPALQDTYYSLAALEILGGLDKIDREACINGILKHHAGRGFFTSPESGSINEYHIDGSARDTIAAFESLRILGALDRVGDLDKWQFRPSRNGVAEHQLIWNDVEAWVCQQRLSEIMRERQENPSKPIGSLIQKTRQN